jgi:hypothetical protein
MVDFAAHGEKLWAEICELSPHMKNRSANLLTEIVHEAAKNHADGKVRAAIARANELGMNGLEWVDRSCVAPGWLALYRKELARLDKDGSLDANDRSIKAAEYADDIVGLTQPSSRKSQLPPLFKGNSELANAFLQFTSSLSTIWQMTRYDIPAQFRNKETRKWAGTIVSMTVTGIVLGALCSGFDDDDDEKDKAAKIALWATSQFTGAFPIIGSEVSRIAETAITGRPQFTGGSTIFPALQKLSNTTGSFRKGLTEKDFNATLKGMAGAAEAFALESGTPVSAIKEYLRLIGVGDGDGSFGFYLWALLGRR